MLSVAAGKASKAEIAAFFRERSHELPNAG